ncbi:toxin [Rhizobium binxianense]
MDIRWSDEKNDLLKQKFGFGFERIIIALDEGDFLDDRRHVNLERYPNQRQLLVRIEDYAWVVPYVEAEGAIFFKTFFPSRRATREYLKGGQ